MTRAAGPGARADQATGAPAGPADVVAVGRRVLALEAGAIRALAERLGEGFVAAVELVERCRGRTVVTGMGKSGLVGRKLVSTLAATGTPALFLHPAEGVHGDLGMLVPGDVAIALSNSGETDEILALLPAIKRLGVPLIVLTGRPRSRLARHGDVVLDVSVAEEACPMNLTPTASAAAALALGDALAIAVLTRRGFGPEDFRQRHPAGTIGRRLIRVEELMHRGAEVPRAPREASLETLVRTMSAGRLGCAAVVDEEGRLAGMVTDGDLRRALERGRVSPAITAGALMSQNPRTVGRSELATTALELMERHGITQLLIVDGEGRPDGLIHLHDLLRAKLA